jgi:hypothetical protein
MVRKDDMVNCPHCGKDFLPVQDQRYCPFCGEQLQVSDRHSDSIDADDQTGKEAPEGRDAEPFGPGRGPYCPWEDQEDLGFFKGISQTVTQSLFSPRDFFARCPRSGGFVVPLLYALIVKTTGSLASFLWLFSMDNPLLAKFDLSGDATILVGLMIPVGLFLSVVIEAAAVHLSLFLLGGAREEFEATFRVVCYGSGPELLDVVPVIGQWAGIAWKTYLIIVGLREFHRISTSRAVLAIVLPSLICFGLILISFAMVARSVGLS